MVSRFDNREAVSQSRFPLVGCTLVETSYGPGYWEDKSGSWAYTGQYLRIFKQQFINRGWKAIVEHLDDG
jgi:hypothetical protein